MHWQAGGVGPEEQADGFIVQAGASFLVEGRQVIHAPGRLRERGLLQGARHPLGRLDGQRLFLLDLDPEGAPTGEQWSSLRQLQTDEHWTRLLPVLGYAAQIATWAREHRFCGRCGTPLQRHALDQAMQCPACALLQYPRLSPCMIVLVRRGEQVLLAHSPRHPPGMYSTLAGFVEPGETVEACVMREVFEEVALQVTNIRYIASQSWPFPHALMLGFHADYAGGEIRPQPGEIEDARWFDLDALPALPGRHSIARYLIELHRAEALGLPPPEPPLF